MPKFKRQHRDSPAAASERSSSEVQAVMSNVATQTVMPGDAPAASADRTAKARDIQRDYLEESTKKTSVTQMVFGSVLISSRQNDEFAESIIVPRDDASTSEVQCVAVTDMYLMFCILICAWILPLRDPVDIRQDKQRYHRAIRCLRALMEGNKLAEQPGPVQNAFRSVKNSVRDAHIRPLEGNEACKWVRPMLMDMEFPWRDVKNGGSAHDIARVSYDKVKQAYQNYESGGKDFDEWMDEFLLDWHGVHLNILIVGVYEWESSFLSWSHTFF